MARKRYKSEEIVAKLRQVDVPSFSQQQETTVLTCPDSMSALGPQLLAMKTGAHFRLILMPCCGQMLCWVNPRLPNYLDRVYRAR